MLQSRILINLPSQETSRGKTVGEWLGSVFGSKPDLRSGKEILTISAYAVLEGLVDGFEASGFDDVISFSIDGRGVYVDKEERPNDLLIMHDVVKRSGVLNRHFQEMRLAFTHIEEELHIIAEVILCPHVMLGEEELIINLSARIRGLEHQYGESARDYQERVEAFARDDEALDPSIQLFDEITKDLATALHECTPGAVVDFEETSVRLTRPNAKQLSRYRNVPFDDDQWSGRFRHVPAFPQNDRNYDPFSFYYYDPFYDFMMWSLVGAVVSYSLWEYDYISFYDYNGGLLGYGHELDSAVFYDSWDYHDDLHFDDYGSVNFAESFPVYDDYGSYENPMEADYHAYNAAIEVETMPVYDPNANGFVEAGYDQQPINYQESGYGQEGQFEQGQGGMSEQGQQGEFEQGMSEQGESMYQSQEAMHEAPVEDWSQNEGGAWDEIDQGFGESEENW